jgi:predicted nucleic acid-binding protein
MNKFLLDSDILIDHLRGAYRIEGLAKRLAINQKGSCYISVITISEIFSGQSMQNPSHRKQAVELMGSFLKIDLNESIAEHAGELRRLYKIPLIDALIAASAEAIFNFDNAQ